MQKVFSLGELAHRFRVSRRQVWEWMLAFPAHLAPTVGPRGQLVFPAGTLQSLARILAAQRQGFTETETAELLAHQAGDSLLPQEPRENLRAPLPSSMASVLQTVLEPLQRHLERLQGEIEALKSRPT